MSARRAAAEPGESLDELERFLATAPESLRPWAQAQFAAARRGERDPQPRRRGVSAALVPLLALLLVVGVVYGVYVAGKPAAPAATGATTAPAAPQLDEGRVKELAAKVQADPKDVTSLRGLTDEYYAVGDYAKAAQWQAKVVDLQPNDVSSRLVLGASLANAGDAAKAEEQWVKVTQLDPKQAEAWYNLGILHFSADPAQDAKARAEWAKVVEIDPNSNLAKNVTSHLSRLSTATTGAASTSPAASAPATR